MITPSSPVSTRLGNKENVPFHSPSASPPSPKGSSSPRGLSSSPLQLRVPRTRVVFALSNRHHPYAHQPRPLPASRLVHKPSKSILRTPSTKFLAPPLILQSIMKRDPSPEPEGDPLQHPEYLVSPVKTILASFRQEPNRSLLPVSKKDLSEAYSTLATRLRAQFRTGRPPIPTEPICPALIPIRDSAKDLASAIVRDLRRPLAATVFDDLDTSEDSSSSENQAQHIPSTASLSSSPLPSSPRTPKKKGVSAEEITHARDLFILTQSVIRVTAAIFNADNLHSLFSNQDLGDILDGLLNLPLAERLFIPNARKSAMLTMWAIHNIRIPSDVVRPLGPKVVDALERAITGRLGKEGKKGAGCEAMTAVHVLCYQYPSIFTPLCRQLLRPILTNCTTTTSSVKSRAPFALGGIVLGLLKFESESPSDQALLRAQSDLSEAVIAYFNDILTRAEAGDLAGHLEYASSNFDFNDDHSASPQWAFSILTPLIVLAREGIFHARPLVACIKDSLTQVLFAKATKSPVKGQVSAMRVATKSIARLSWCTLVWAASKCGLGDENEKVFKMVAQMKTSPANICLIGELVAARQVDEAGNSTSTLPSYAQLKMAINYLGDIIKDSQNAGIYILRRLVCGTLIDNESRGVRPWCSSRMICNSLLDGSLLNADSRLLPGLAKDFLSEVPSSDDVRALTLAEKQDPELWLALMVAWENMVGRIGFTQGEDELEAPEVVFEIWRQLLMDQAPLIHNHDSDSLKRPTIIRVIGDNLAAFLEPAGNWGNTRTLQDKDDQVVSLTFVKKLWEITNEVLGPFVSSNPLAEESEDISIEYIPVTLVDGLLDPQDLTIDSRTNAAVFELWSDILCDALLNAPANSLIRICEDMVWQDDSSRELWNILAGRIARESATEATGLEECIALMTVPFSESTEPVSVNRDEWLLWEALLDTALHRAGQSTTEGMRASVFNRISEDLAGCGAYEYRAALRGASILVSKITFSCNPSQGDLVLESSPLSLASRLLSRNSPKVLRRARDVDLVLELIGNLTTLLNECPSDSISAFLHILQHGISVWLANEKPDASGISADQYNEWIIPFYVSSLKRLGQLPSCSQTLAMHAHLLISVFRNAPAPELGPVAFKTFWQDRYMTSGLLKGDIPEELLPVLRAFMVKEGESFAPCLSYGVDPSPQVPSNPEGPEAMTSLPQDDVPATQVLVPETLEEEVNSPPPQMDIQLGDTSGQPTSEAEAEQTIETHVIAPLETPLQPPDSYDTATSEGHEESEQTVEQDSHESVELHQEPTGVPLVPEVSTSEPIPAASSEDSENYREEPQPEAPIVEEEPTDSNLIMAVDDSSSQPDDSSCSVKQESIEIENIELDSSDEMVPSQESAKSETEDLLLYVDTPVSAEDEVDVCPTEAPVEDHQSQVVQDEEDIQLIDISLPVVMPSSDPLTPTSPEEPAPCIPVHQVSIQTPKRESDQDEESIRSDSPNLPDSPTPQTQPLQVPSFMNMLTESMVGSSIQPTNQPAVSPIPLVKTPNAKPRKRLFLEAVEVPLLSSLKRRRTTESQQSHQRDVFVDLGRPLTRSASQQIENRTGLPFTLPSTLSEPRRKRTRSSGSPEIVVASTDTVVELSDAWARDGRLTMSQPLKRRNTEPELIADDAHDEEDPSSFHGLVGSSALKQSRLERRPNSMEADGPETEPSSPTTSRLGLRKPLQRSHSNPAPRPQVRSVSDRPTLRTQSLSAALIEHVRQAADAREAVRDLGPSELSTLRRLLNNLHEEIDSALVDLATGQN